MNIPKASWCTIQYWNSMFVEAYSVDGSAVSGAMTVQATAVSGEGSGGQTSPQAQTSFNGGLNTTPPVYRDPMYESSPKLAPQTVELYENERYSPRLGFCAKGLIIGDRGNFSDCEGTWSYSTIDEAASQLLSRGWQWTGQWQIVGNDAFGTVTQYTPSTGSGDDGGGWMYNSDFGSYSADKPGFPKKGLTHFVRRRKLMRIRTFDENTICNDETHTCQSCDMKQLEALSTMLMDLFYGAYTARYSAKDLKVLKVIKMKNLFVDALMKANNVRSFDFNSVAQMMVEFANSQKPRSHNTLARFNPADAFCRQVEQHFPLLERWGLARATLRKYDSMHEYHCNINFCGASCPFAVQRCPHEGCQVRFSKRWWGEHDAVCPFKIVPCPLLCGMFVARRSTQEHTANSCIMRPVPCPYARIGCNPPGLIFRDVEAHCNLNPAYHLGLSMAHIQKVEGEKEQIQSEVAALRIQLLQTAQAGRRY